MITVSMIIFAACWLTAAVDAYDGVVLEGGGVRGVSFVGAMRAFEDRGLYANGAYEFRDVIGTSVGCMFGLAIALDIEPQQLEKLVLETNFATLFDPVVSDLINYPTRCDATSAFSGLTYAYRWFRYFVTCLRIWLDRSPMFGLSDDSRLTEWIDTKLVPLSRYSDRISTASTLLELTEITNHTLTCFATRVYDVGIVRLDSTNSPQSTIRDTIFASATLPLIFQPRIDQNGFPLIDGSLLMNFPIYAADTKHETANVLGLSLNFPLYDTEHLTFETCEYANPKRSILGNMLVSLTKMFYRKKQIVVEGRSPVKTSDAIYSSVDFLKHIARIMIHDREWLRYSSDSINCDRVVYLDSPLNVMDIDANEEKIKQSIVKAYANTVKFLDNRDAMTCNCLAYIYRQNEFRG